MTGLSWWDINIQNWYLYLSNCGLDRWGRLCLWTLNFHWTQTRKKPLKWITKGSLHWKNDPRNLKSLTFGLPPYSEKVIQLFFKSLLKLDHLWGTFGENILFSSKMIVGVGGPPHHKVTKKVCLQIFEKLNLWNFPPPEIEKNTFLLDLFFIEGFSNMQSQIVCL